MTVNNASGSLLITVRWLTKTPGADGEKLTVRRIRSPGFKAVGKAGAPLNPNGKLGAWMLPISRSASPVFLSSTVVTDEPLRKSTTGGVISRLGTGLEVPVPPRLTVTFGL